ncbi:MAG: recombinase family protein [Xenococcaceae cyanobacterium]
MEKSSRLRTTGGHRRYEVAELLNKKSGVSLTIGYARVSSHDQKDDLERQKIVLDAYCVKHGWQCELISDLGSGMNYKKRGLREPFPTRSIWGTNQSSPPNSNKSATSFSPISATSKTRE